MNNKNTHNLENLNIIDAGHFTYTKGPTKLDLELFKIGINIYNQKTAESKLIILIDDMEGIKSNKERREIKLELPKEYKKTLYENHIDENEVIILSQNKMREKGKKWLRERNISRSIIGQCELIVAAIHKWKEQQGCHKTILIYEPEKTANGITLLVGIQKAKELFKTKLEPEIRIYKNPTNYTTLKA